MKYLTLFLLALAISTGHAQLDLEKTTGEIGPVYVSLKKPPKYEHYSPCEVVFINYTYVPLQINRVHPSGRMEKLIYIDQKDTVKMQSMTNHHLLVCYQGNQAGSMFIPAFDVNIVKIHDKQFNKTKKIPKRKFKPIKGDITADKKFKYKPAVQTYGKGKGPIVYFDEGHLTNNSIKYNYKPLAKLLESDGYQVKPYYPSLSERALNTGKTMVISNAYGQSVNGYKVDSAYAFIQEEVKELKTWVENGGRLLLIMDHTPYPGRVENIAKAFGFTFWDCHAIDTSSNEPGQLVNKELRTLAKHAITEGRNDNEEIDQIATFQGACMEIPKQAKSIITLDDNYIAVFSHGAFNFQASDIRKSAAGTSQAAVMDYGQGKVAVFCEADLFTALKSKESGDKLGMSYKYANENPQFVLNVFHWLDGFIE